jgi:hypothetical protein
MRKHLVAGGGVLVLLCSSVDAQSLSIDHHPVECAVAETLPRLEARFVPADTEALVGVGGGVGAAAISIPVQ